MVLKIQDNKIPMDEEIKRQFEEQLRALGERFGITNLQLKNFGDAAKKGADAFKKSLDELNKEIKKGRAGYADQLRALEQLNDAIEELSDQAQDSVSKDKVTQLQKQRAALLEQAARQNTTEQLEYFGEELKKAAITGTGRFVRDLQSNASSVQLTSGILNAGIDVAGAAATGLGKGLQATGAAMSLLHPVAGMLVGGFGTLSQFVGEAGAKLAKFGVEIFAVELEKTVKAFHDISAGGALFSDGMQGMRDAAKASMLTLEDFSAVIGRQSANLAATGLSVPTAVRKLGGALASGGEGMRKNLLNLGFRIEEHGDLVAETMALMRSGGGPLRAGNDQIAIETQKLGEHLRLVAAITGEDAKTRLKAAQEQANQLAFQQKLAALPEEQRIAVMKAFNLADTETRKNFMDLVNFGAVINQSGAATTAIMSAQREKQDRMLSLYNQGTLDEESFLNIKKDLDGKILKQANDQYGGMGGVAMAAAGGVDGLVREMSEGVLRIRKDLSPDPDALTEAEQTVKNQMGTTNLLTDQMNTAAIQAKGLAIALQEVTLKLLPFAASINAKVLEAANAAAEYAMRGSNPKGTSPSAMKMSNEDLTKQMQLTGADPRTGRGLSNQEFKDLKDKGTIPELKTGKAQGGISRGPVSGYSEILHGTEAVVPLPDGRSIPVSLDSSSITAAVNQQSGILAEILRAMQNNNSLTSQIVQNSY